MRLRRKPYAKQMVREHARVVNDPQKYKGKWRSVVFRNEHPLYLELGTGKGRFLSRVCQEQPDINWIGVERIEEILLQALNKSEELLVDNLRFLWMDVKQLPDCFAAGEVDRIYLHFSDPWPKKRHTKRRLTHRSFLHQYKSVLKPGGELLLKTDNQALFQFSLDELEEAGYKLVESTHDLYASPFAAGNIPTEYEEKFTSKNMPIHYLLAQPKSS
ncbi:tRNA (guanosine(46)-N7)-methyltransferase TrmB [Desmospora profundinema]|uniref:tRNA (guanine-N(7)-)-methyltransferase n=1 Tax=Desmospora profundinema TaxID=1571184 RepID=A0ABU1IRN2_9BACL|nr:tRNA (guanosine(46)-N7)-methyltransferase TrmB [Desmospora profundinema]MDR6227449.1 tRNA (guanine-N7-)-methyltransferase [Desmospora profundinema]